MRPWSLVVLGALVMPGTLLAAAAALAPASRYAGTWRFSGDAEGAAACTVGLKTAPVIGGYRIDVPSSCAKAFRLASDIAAWRPAPGGAIAFADPTRHALLTFEPTAEGDFVAHDGSGAGFVLGRAGPSRPMGMAGAWRLNALGGVQLCAFDLTAGRDGASGAVRRRPGCKAPWSARPVRTWRMSAGRLVFEDGTRHPILKFKRLDLVTFQADTPGADLFLVRP